MSRDTHWRHDSGREVRYSRPDPGHQPPAAWPDVRGDTEDSPRARPNSRLPGLQGSGLAHSGRPLGSPALSILAKGRHVSPERGTAQQQEAEHRLGVGSRRSRGYELAAQRSPSPANGRHVAQEKVAHDAPMSRLVKRSPHRRSLVPVELPPIDADRTAMLHEEILRFAARVVPDAEEDERRRAAHGQMQAACAVAKLPTVRPFGSRASGLELWDSDIDLVVLGVVEPSGDNHTLLEGEKEEVNFHLARLTKILRRTYTMQKLHHIRRARVPIIKCTSPAGVDVDVSIGDDRGIRAARWLLRCQERWLALRPLVLLLKGVLRVLELHDVSQGGLGSFSLSNMVIAHLQEEEKEGRDTANLGILSLTFLMRYGIAFAFDRHAVSVGQGGVISRASLTHPIPSGQLVQLVVEDVDTKRDVAGGSYRMGDVAVTFAGAAAACEKALRRTASPSDSLLVDIFGDCCIQKALSREPVNCDPWAAWDPLPSPDSARRHMSNGLQEITELADEEALHNMAEPVNGLHSTAEAGAQDMLQVYSRLKAARDPRRQAKRTAVFLDPFSRASIMQWAPPKYGRGQADSVLLAEHPPLPKLAATPLGEKVDLPVVGTADDGQVQILVIKLPEHLEPSSTGASYFAVSISDEASIDAAAEMAESIASGHRQGIRLEAFPQPRVLKGTVGVEVEEGPMFFHASELHAFWEAEGNGAESETESMLAADEEGLGHLRVKAHGGLGFFEPMSLPAAGTPKEQGANKRKSMDLGAQPPQNGELTQGDRWEEGNDPELFNLRRKTSRDEAPRCAQSPMQRTSSSRGPPAPGSAAPQGDLPPHLLAQHPSGKTASQAPSKTGTATRAFSTEWPSLAGRPSIQAAPVGERDTPNPGQAANGAVAGGAAKGNPGLGSGRQPSMTLGKTDGRTLADFMPQAGATQRPSRRGQTSSRGQPRSTIAVGQPMEQKPAAQDLPPHLRQR